LEFQKKGAINNFTSAIDSLQAMSANCSQMLSDCEEQLQKEEAFDTKMRGAHSDQWNILASSAINQPYKQNIQSYRDKIKIASHQD
jgi:glucose-6-phosphate dehydrogenase assembly protein OpcA